MTGKKRVLFVCTYNSVRSQMAEGILRHLYGDYYDVTSAGVAPAGLHPLAVEILREKGVDISRQKSRSVMQLREETFDILVTLCDDVKKKCTLPLQGARIIHRPFHSPPEFDKDQEKVLVGFRALREEMWRFIDVTFRPPRHGD
jgi:arsenate reductase